MTELMTECPAPADETQLKELGLVISPASDGKKEDQ